MHCILLVLLHVSGLLFRIVHARVHVFQSDWSVLACVGELDYSSVLLGMLVMQDVQLGLFIAVMPTLIQVGNGTLDR